ncbi:hypothetical protein PBRA_004070 [Plasmodiophora brassicae]|uniref:Magnesium transporter n=1 Tax=Plasmodiophora brassicae TaxID=37360 RepID=A0A0G4IJF9_PLABS|nr:hypothetical protein PBRA_004070 [Plasmodiophora brassicae]
MLARQVGVWARAPHAVRVLACSRSASSSAGKATDNGAGLTPLPFKQRQFPTTRRPPSPLSRREFDVLRFKADGEFTKEKVSVEDLLKVSGIYARDLLLLDTSHGNPHSVILPRGDSLLVNFFVKAIVYRDRAIIFDANKSTIVAFANSFKTYLTSASDKRLAFELRAVEGILSLGCERHYRRLSLYGPVIQALLNQLTDQLEGEAILRRLLAVKNSLSSFEVDSQEYKTTMTDLLNNDEDMANMNLTLRSQLAPGETVDRSEHQDVELMIESYLRQMTEMYQHAYYLRKSIESAQEILNINLSSHRNRMIKMDLQMAMGSVSLAASAVIASTFGMNLPSGFEASPTAFWAMATSIIVIAPIIYAACHRYAEGSPRSSQYVMEVKSIDSLLANISEVEQVLVNHACDDVGIDREQFRALLQLETGRAVRAEEAQMLFDVFDVPQDEKITFQKYLNSLNRRGIRENGFLQT